MYRFNVLTTQQEHQQQQKQTSSSSSHILLHKEPIEQRQEIIAEIKNNNNNIALQKSINDVTRKSTIIPTKLNVLENISHATIPTTPATTITLTAATTTTTTRTNIAGVDSSAADLTLPHLIRICGTKTSPTIINTDPLRLPIRDESMTSDINNESLSEQQQNAFLRHGNEMDKIAVLANSTTVVMAASLEDKLKYLAALKTEPITNEIIITTTTAAAAATVTTTTPLSTSHIASKSTAITTTICEDIEPKIILHNETTTKTTKSATFTCSECGKSFTRNFQLKLHQNSVHNIGNALPYKCHECLKEFASRSSLNYHIKSLHSNDRPFTCAYCGRQFILRTQLASHVRVHTGEMKARTHECQICGKFWPTKSDLRLHLRSHNPDLQRPFNCDRCEKRFFSRGHLQSHILVHTGEKPFTCLICNKSYQSIGNLNNHIVRHHADLMDS